MKFVSNKHNQHIQFVMKLFTAKILAVCTFVLGSFTISHAQTAHTTFSTANNVTTSSFQRSQNVTIKAVVYGGDLHVYASQNVNLTGTLRIIDMRGSLLRVIPHFDIVGGQGSVAFTLNDPAVYIVSLQDQNNRTYYCKIFYSK